MTTGRRFPAYKNGRGHIIAPPLTLTVVSNLVHTKVFFPLLTNQKELCGYNVQKFIQIVLRNFAGIVCNNAFPRPCQPYFCRILGWLSFNNMDVNWFSIFIGPEENQIASYAKQTRHSEFLLDRRSGRANERSVSEIPRRS